MKLATTFSNEALRTHRSRLLFLYLSASTLKMSTAEEFPTVTTGQPHLAKQDLSKLVRKGKCYVLFDWETPKVTGERSLFDDWLPGFGCCGCISKCVFSLLC